MDNMTYMHQLGFRPIFTDGAVSHWTTGWIGMNGEPIQQTISDQTARLTLDYFGHYRPSHIFWLMLGWERDENVFGYGTRKNRKTIRYTDALKQWRRAKRHARQLAQVD
jgi:hypothetical protein